MASSKSIIWTVFKQCHGEQLGKAECTLCEKTEPSRFLVRGKTVRDWSTSPLWNHLKSKHPMKYMEIKTPHEFTSRNKRLSEHVASQSDLDAKKVSEKQLTLSECFARTHAWEINEEKSRKFSNLIEIDDENIGDNTLSSSPVSRPPSPSHSGMAGPHLLKKETHCSSILDELLKDDTFTDVTLTAEGQHLKAHRIILCLSSKYFKDVLSKESATKNIIFFRDIKFEELKNIITFIYTGEVTVDASDLESFMKTAELLEVTSLCEGHKNFPKGFPISQPSEPHRIFKPTGTAKRTISNSSYSPPTKSRKTISGAETTFSPMKSSRKRSQPTALSSFVTIKTEPDVTEGEYFSECESREDQLETSNAFVDVGHLSEEELQPTTPFKDESNSDNEMDSDSLQQE